MERNARLFRAKVAVTDKPIRVRQKAGTQVSEINAMSVPLIRPVRLWPGSHVFLRASWLELFFDLIFVAAVSQVGVPLGEDYTLHGVIRYGFMFLLIWWAWFGHTMYSTRFDANDVVHRLLTLVQIFAAAAMDANAKGDLASRDSAGFGAAYAVQRLVLVIQYLRARREKQTRALTTTHTLGFGIAALLWIVAALVPPPARFVLWGLALAIDLATPWIATKYTHTAPTHPEHLPERFGLFTIILLGESVAAVMRGMESQESWPVSAAISAFSALALVFALWWWYFDVACGAAERHVKSRTDSRLLELWSHAHFPLYLSIAVLGVGLERIISFPTDTHLAADDAWILIGAALIAMGSLIVIAAAFPNSKPCPAVTTPSLGASSARASPGAIPTLLGCHIPFMYLWRTNTPGSPFRGAAHRFSCWQGRRASFL